MSMQTAARCVAGLAIALFIMVGGQASGADIVEFQDIPVTEPQATLEIVQACRNGIMFGLYAESSHAVVAGEPRNWDITLVPDDADPLFKEYRLWLDRSATPLIRGPLVLPYSEYFTLGWNEMIPAGPLTTCIAGPGTGFCEFTFEINECRLDPTFVVYITQVGPEDTGRTVGDSLVFEAHAFDPYVGTANGDGVSTMTLQIIDQVSGSMVASRTYAASQTEGADEADRRFCAFEEACTPWVFSENDFLWPDGTAVHSGPYLLRATATGDDRNVAVTQMEVSIDIPFQPSMDADEAPEDEQAQNEAEVPSIDRPATAEVPTDPDAGQADANLATRVNRTIRRASRPCS